MAFSDFFKKKQAREKVTRGASAAGPAEEAGALSEKRVEAAAVAASVGSSKTASILLGRPHITEKTTQFADKGIYAFRVSDNATRPAIRRAVEELYRVHVVRVNLLSQPSSAVKHWRHAGRRPGFRKAYVMLKKGQAIEFT